MIFVCVRLKEKKEDNEDIKLFWIDTRLETDSGFKDRGSTIILTQTLMKLLVIIKG